MAPQYQRRWKEFSASGGKTFSRKAPALTACVINTALGAISPIALFADPPGTDVVQL